MNPPSIESQYGEIYLDLWNMKWSKQEQGVMLKTEDSEYLLNYPEWRKVKDLMEEYGFERPE